MSEWHACAELGLNPKTTGRHFNLIGATGSQLEILGEVDVKIEIGNAICEHNVLVVRGRTHDCILGRDMLQAIPCQMKSDGAKSQFSNSPVMWLIPKIAKIVLQKKVTIPPHHEMVLGGRARRLSGKPSLREGIVEQDDRLTKTNIRVCW